MLNRPQSVHVQLLYSDGIQYSIVGKVTCMCTLQEEEAASCVGSVKTMIKGKISLSRMVLILFKGLFGLLDSKYVMEEIHFGFVMHISTGSVKGASSLLSKLLFPIDTPFLTVR